MERQYGIVCGGVPARGFFFIGQGAGETFRKFFGHVRQVLPSEMMPEVGQPVSFEVSPITEGRLPTAIKIQFEEVAR
jgi:hypothetical protein